MGFYSPVNRTAALRLYAAAAAVVLVAKNVFHRSVYCSHLAVAAAAVVLVAKNVLHRSVYCSHFMISSSSSSSSACS